MGVFTTEKKRKKNRHKTLKKAIPAIHSYSFFADPSGNDWGLCNYQDSLVSCKEPFPILKTLV